VTITANNFISQLGLTATRVLRASIRIVAGQASKEAVGCELVDRSAGIDPSVTDQLPILFGDSKYIGSTTMVLSRLHADFSWWSAVSIRRWHGYRAADLSTELINSDILLVSYVAANRDDIIIAKSLLRHQCLRSIIFAFASNTISFIIISFNNRFEFNSNYIINGFHNMLVRI